MNWVSVRSSHIDAIGWDESADGVGRLWVKFDSGVYGYYSPCPRSMFDDMLSAPSKGTYKHRVLILGGYKWSEVSVSTAKRASEFQRWVKARQR